MCKLFVLVFFFSHLNVNRACKIIFPKLDAANIFRHTYERYTINITGQLQYCPPSIRVRNISIANPSLKRLSILNVTYVLETKSINIIAFGRTMGFAPVTIQLYFRDRLKQKLPYLSLDNATEEEKKCGGASKNRTDILQNCPMLQFENGYYILTEQIQVAIKRRQTIIDTLFTAVVTFLVTMGTLCIGCDLELEQLTQNIQRPIPLLIGLFCQIVYLPVLSLLITKVFQLDSPTSLGLLSTASCPGGSSSNIYTALLGGHVDLSVIMTFMSTTLSFGTFPFWVWTFGSHYINFARTKFPWWNMFLSLMTLFLPAFSGLLIRRYRPVLAYRIGRFLNPIAVGYIVFILTFGIYINMYIFTIIDLKAIVACCLLPWFGFVGGAILSFIGVRDKKKSIAICIETGVQNTAVAIVFLRLTFPQPEADIALANPILVSMAIPVPFLFLVLTRSLLARFTFCQKFLPHKQDDETMENGIHIETPEKLIAKELLDEKNNEQVD